MNKRVNRAKAQLEFPGDIASPTNGGWVSPFDTPALRHLSPAEVTPVYDVFWYFAAERQKIFFNRLRRTNGPWTSDPILIKFKFTNAYRAADRVSQYLIRNVIYRNDLPDTKVEVFFRILLFKLFNKIETWEALEEDLGPLTFEEFNFSRYDETLSRLKHSGVAIYSAAYIMHPGSSAFGQKLKHQNHLLLLKRMIDDGLPERIADTSRMQEGFELLTRYPTIGDFLGYQLITDLNYSEITDYSEMEFVVPGPGALDGISKCFSSQGGLNAPEIIRMMADIQEAEFERLELSFESLWGRRLQLIDCQNLFCEVSKYSRVSHPDIAGVSGRKRIKQKFVPKEEPIDLWFPPKWGLNEGGLR